MRFTDTRRITYILLILFKLTICANARDFTDKAGNGLEATILSATEDTVILKTPFGGPTHTVSISELSDSDQEYIKAYKIKIAKIRRLATATKTSNQTTQKTVSKKTPSRTSPQKVEKVITNKSIEKSASEALKAKYHLADNYSTPWPTSTSVSRSQGIGAASEDKANSRYVYQSANYEFISDVKLSTNIAKKFSLIFEATREYCRRLPISSMKAHVPGRGVRNKILLFGSMNNYIKNGGVVGSAGVFIPSKNIVLIPLSSLGVQENGGKYSLDHSESNIVLTHELVHQLTDSEYYQHGARGWFSEGLAEYCAATPYMSGQYVTRSNQDNIKAYVTSYGRDNKEGRNLGEKINAPNLKDFMLQPYGSFVSNANYNYGLGTLITYYFFHLEPDRRNITSFLKALKQGRTGEDALTALLNGRTFDQLEADISKAWKNKGVQIDFN
ncbi:hypothetical protein OAI07_02170 [Akkermansiaceae bacterium]|nr:hypothetical protein [Akkermansiaceae bacterium]